MKARILVVDDEPATTEVLRRNLEGADYSVSTTTSVRQAVKILDASTFDLVITDFRMPEVTGLDLVKHIRQNCKGTAVVMITGYGTIDGAVQAIKAGAAEYLAKPFTDEELLGSVARALESSGAREGRPAPIPSAGEILGESEAMRRVFAAIRKAADSPATVLITGESGTGKELVARAIHYSSSRAPAPFVPVNCAAIPEPLLESELFGHAKGAFTGAIESRPGFFQIASGGTLLLDEVSDTPPAMQAKLLRVLQDHEVRMVGSGRATKVDVRVIAATNQDLPTLVKKGSFRKDLYFRLHVLAIEIPPLRERGDDLVLLARQFASRHAAELGRKPPELTEAAVQVLKSYAWPGNVRELQNTIQRLVVMSDGEAIDAPDFPEFMRFSLRGGGRHRTLAQVEAEHIRAVLESVGGNVSRAARILGIDRKTLRGKLR